MQSPTEAPSVPDAFRPEVKRDSLVVLVTDIRGSTQALQQCPDEDHRRFLSGFCDLTDESLRAWTSDKTAYHINAFLGDGFLAFLCDINIKGQPVSLNSGALSAAIHAAADMRKRFRRWCDTIARELGHAKPALRKDFQGMDLVAGLTFGEIPYGRFTSLQHLPSTGIGEDVLKTFRLAQSAQGGEILITEEAYRVLERQSFRVSQKALPNVRGFPNGISCYSVFPRSIKR